MLRNRKEIVTYNISEDMQMTAYGYEDDSCASGENESNITLVSVVAAAEVPLRQQVPH
jgi:hypothetical protein